MTTAHDLLQRHIQTLAGDHERWLASRLSTVLGKDSHLTNERRRRETQISARSRQIVVLKFHANTRWLLAEGRAGNRGWRIRRRRRRLCARP